LSRARDLLRCRLARRGLAVPAVLLAAGLDREAAALTVVPPTLTEATVHSAVAFISRRSPALVAAGAVPPAVQTLSRADPRSMAPPPIKLAGSLSTVAALASGAAVVAEPWQQPAPEPTPTPTPVVAAEPVAQVAPVAVPAPAASSSTTARAARPGAQGTPPPA